MGREIELARENGRRADSHLRSTETWMTAVRSCFEQSEAQCVMGLGEPWPWQSRHPMRGAGRRWGFVRPKILYKKKNHNNKINIRRNEIVNSDIWNCPGVLKIEN
jgi:hypothetical protein